jgi:hypothetical protein
MCASATKTAALRARERRESFDYDAFISYAHEIERLPRESRKVCKAVIKFAALPVTSVAVGSRYSPVVTTPTQLADKA